MFPIARPRLALPCALLAGALAAPAGAAAAELGAPLSAATGTCPPGGGSPFVSFTPAPPARAVISASATGGPLTVWEETMDDGDLVWDAIENGVGTIGCAESTGPVGYGFEAHATPDAPVTYRGRGGRMASLVAVRLPFPGALVADVTVTDGTVSLAPVDLKADPPVGTPTAPTSSATATPLGVRAAGRHVVLVDPTGPRPSWSTHFRILPATISGLQLPAAITAATPTVAGQYTLDQPGRVSIEVLSAGGSPVTTLQTAKDQAAGTQALTWDAKTAPLPRRPLPDGRYAIRISGLDAGGTTSTATAPVVVDRVGPTLAPRIASVLLRDPLRLKTSDATSGVAEFRVTLPASTGKPGVVTVPPGETSVSIPPPAGGWPVGVHKLSAEAVDTVGNRTSREFDLSTVEVFGQACGRSAGLDGVLNSLPVMKALRATPDARSRPVEQVFTVAKVICARLDKDAFREMAVVLRRTDKRKGSITPLIVFRVSDEGFYRPRVISTRYAISGLAVRGRQLTGTVPGRRQLTVRDAGGKLVLSVKRRPKATPKRR